MHDVLDDLAKTLQRFLGKMLPSCNTQWWEKCVLTRLTFQQQRLAKQKNATALNNLDLAALLRILDQNWQELSAVWSPDPEVRNWLKESQTVRNRWAHLPPGGLPVQDHYRDLDTVYRLMQALNADEESLRQVCESRNEVFATLGKSQASDSSKSNQNLSGCFAKGDIVRLKARPDLTGAVIDILDSGDEVRYLVFHDGNTSTYYGSQIETAVGAATHLCVKPNAMHAALSALQLRHPSTGHLYSLFSSRIHFVPYQFRPVLKLIQSDRPRMLIADEVGVGKTIEAGLILKELQARQDVRSVLVICPKPLVAERKWQEEMKRFDEQFVHLDGDTLRYCIEESHLDGDWPQQYSRAIVPYSLFDEDLLMGKQKGRRRQRGLLELNPPPKFDLIIVDEAHHIRNTDTWTYRTVRFLCDNAEAVVLLSATPIQLGDNDLFNLLHLVRPDLLPSRRDFDRMAEPNPHLNAAIEAARSASPDWKENVRRHILRAIATLWGKEVIASDPRLQSAYDLLNETNNQTESRLLLIQHLEQIYTFAPIINRTRRRDIGNFTTRKPETVVVEFTSEQAELNNELISLIVHILKHRHGDDNLKFMLSTVRRQVASCVFGLAPLLEAIMHRHLSRIEVSEAGDENTPEELGELLSEYRSEVDALITKARAITGQDPKYESLRRIIKEKQNLPNNKLLVFSSFRHTLKYLIDRLKNESIRVGIIHGDVPDEERRELRNRFSLGRENPQSIDILLSSEVGCEGLDYQFCNGLVNYDLPWNPMRVEQRIGRIDRYGQKSDVVSIYNFVTPGTVDAEIYERCLLRIGVFRQALGGSEEILGRLTREIRNIAENLTLTSTEQAERLQQIADNEIRAIQEQARLEEEQSSLFGIYMPNRDDNMINQASCFWLKPTLLANLVKCYLEQLGIINQEDVLGKKAIDTLRLDQIARNKLLADFRGLKLTGNVSRQWETWLKGSTATLPITFDPSTAEERRNVSFITPIHPLAKQAARCMQPSLRLLCDMVVTTSKAEPGRYPYAIYRWRKLGLKEDFSFQPVCLEPKVVPQMLALLESARNLETELTITSDEEQNLEQIHYRFWCSARAEHVGQITEVSNSRLRSLKTTHTARLSLLEEQRDSAIDERIRRMRESQIDSARDDFARRVEDLERSVQQVDIVAEAVVFGVLIVENEDG